MIDEYNSGTMMIVIVEAVGGQDLVKMILLVARMMDPGQEELGSQELAAGETENRGSKRSGVRREEMMEAEGMTEEGEMMEAGECLQDVDLLHPGTGIEEMQELGGVADLPETTLHPGSVKMIVGMVAVTLETEIAGLHPATMIGMIAALAATIVMTTVVDQERTEEDQEDLQDMDHLAEILDPGDVEEETETLGIEIVAKEVR